jgi:hypothetical protein
LLFSSQVGISPKSSTGVFYTIGKATEMKTAAQQTFGVKIKTAKKIPL